VVWVYSSLRALRQDTRRRERIARAKEAFADLSAPRAQRRKRADVPQRVDDILAEPRTKNSLRLELYQGEEHHLRQASRGRPGPNTRYVRKTRRFWPLRFPLDDAAIEYERKSDGRYPLLTHDRSLTDAPLFEAHQRPPRIKQGFEQTKTVFEIAPVLLKNEGRIAALVFVSFLALLVQALIERELRLAMKRERVETLAIDPEERETHRPPAEPIFRLFSLTQRHVLEHNGRPIRRFEPELTELQRQILDLLGIERSVYRSAP
jgi:hypothetical protein